MYWMSSTESWSAGSEVAAQPEPFAREAKFLSETKALGRDVRVMLEGVDKFGNLFGQVTASPPDRLPPSPPPPPSASPSSKAGCVQHLCCGCYLYQISASCWVTTES